MATSETAADDEKLTVRDSFGAIRKYTPQEVLARMVPADRFGNKPPVEDVVLWILRCNHTGAVPGVHSFLLPFRNKRKVSGREEWYTRGVPYEGRDYYRSLAKAEPDFDGLRADLIDENGNVLPVTAPAENVAGAMGQVKLKSQAWTHQVVVLRDEIEANVRSDEGGGEEYAQGTTTKKKLSPHQLKGKLLKTAEKRALQSAFPMPLNVPAPPFTPEERRAAQVVITEAEETEEAEAVQATLEPEDAPEPEPVHSPGMDSGLPLTEEQKEQIRSYFGEGKLTNGDIAAFQAWCRGNGYEPEALPQALLPSALNWLDARTKEKAEAQPAEALPL